MEKYLNKKLEEAAENMMMDLQVEKPSSNFTSSLMQEIQNLETKEVTQYQPLISKPVWVALSFILIATTIFIAFNSNTSNMEWLQSFNFNDLFENKITHSLSSLSLPKTFAYAIGLFGIMLCVQIPLLKHHFNKRLQV